MAAPGGGGVVPPQVSIVVVVVVVVVALTTLTADNIKANTVVKMSVNIIILNGFFITFLSARFVFVVVVCMCVCVCVYVCVCAGVCACVCGCVCVCVCWGAQVVCCVRCLFFVSPLYFIGTSHIIPPPFLTTRLSN